MIVIPIRSRFCLFSVRRRFGSSGVTDADQACARGYRRHKATRVRPRIARLHFRRQRMPELRKQRFNWINCVTTLLSVRQPRLVLRRAMLRPTTPPSVCFCIANVGNAAGGIVDCVVELKRGLVQQRHSLPRRGWGYPTQAETAVGAVLVESAELWTITEHELSGRLLDAWPWDYNTRSEWRLLFAGVMTYRSASQNVYQTTFHRRLDGGSNQFSLIDDGDAGLEYIGKSVKGDFAVHNL